MIIVPFQAAHVSQMSVQTAQQIELIGFCEPDRLSFLENQFSWSGVIDDVVVGSAGLYEIWPGRHYAWALLSDQLNPHQFVRLTRCVRRALDLLPDARVEAVVQSDFEMGHRWMRALGFKRETPFPMRRYFPHGGDAILYARVK